MRHRRPELPTGTAPQPVAPRATLALLGGCLWCNDDCYDHIIEWLLQVGSAWSKCLQKIERAVT
jgi:hypothetical protein